MGHPLVFCNSDGLIFYILYLYLSIMILVVELLYGTIYYYVLNILLMNYAKTTTKYTTFAITRPCGEL